ncbi:hypothetical protein Pfo_003399, partial [Paulownia fortunei]
EVVTTSEARICKSRSHEYRGRCYNRNCATICKLEGFITGKCERFKCYCLQECRPSSGRVPSQPPPETPPLGYRMHNKN